MMQIQMIVYATVVLKTKVYMTIKGDLIQDTMRGFQFNLDTKFIPTNISQFENKEKKIRFTMSRGMGYK